MKKAVSFLLSVAMLLALAACGNGGNPSGAQNSAAPSGSEGDDTFKIGIVTGTVSQSEDDRRGAEAFQAMYGEDRVVLATYPDNFTCLLYTSYLHCR